MSTESKPDVSGAVILTRGIERLLRKLIRFLIGKISLIRLQEMIRNIYVEESERKLRVEKPGKDVSLTRLALLTGLDTRTLAKIRNDETYRKPWHEVDRFVKSVTPESCVLDLWCSHSDYQDAVTGDPKKLEIEGKGITFEQLVKIAVSSRGVTAQSILNNLLAYNAIKLNERAGTVELLERVIAPYKSGNHWGAFDNGLIHVCSLLGTVIHNFNALKESKTTFFQRGSWTHRLKPADQLEFERVMSGFLRKTNQNAAKLIEEFEENEPGDNQITAGVSMYYFEDRAIN